MIREVHYVLMDPTGNRTILSDTPVPVGEQPAVAEKLMELEPTAEQTGFLTMDMEGRPAAGRAQACAAGMPAGHNVRTMEAAAARHGDRESSRPVVPGSGHPVLRLRMAGGEFCGNATMSAAVYYGMRTGMCRGTVMTEVSGTPDPVPVQIARNEDLVGSGTEILRPGSSILVQVGEEEGSDGTREHRTSRTGSSETGRLKEAATVRDGIFRTASGAGEAGAVWQGIVRMPEPHTVETVSFPDGRRLPVVAFEGISHVIMERPVPGKIAEKLVREWCQYLHADALGLMLLDPKKQKLTPLVYVPAADTLFWESACGSGTSAVGAWMARESGSTVKTALYQPGGILRIEASPDGGLWLEGTVRQLYERTVRIG